MLFGTNDSRNPWFRALSVALTIVTFICEFYQKSEDEDIRKEAQVLDVLTHRMDDVLKTGDTETMITLVSGTVGLVDTAIARGFEPPEIATEYADIQWEEWKEALRTTGANLNDAELRLADKKKGLTATIAKMNEAFEASNAELIAEVAEAQEIHTKNDEYLRAAIFADFLRRGSKQVHPGLSVRINTEYVYEDKDAVEFAIERKMTELLVPDKAAFKKQMALTPQPFCKIRKSGTAVVSLKK